MIMQKGKLELEVDFIGGKRSLTKKEELAITKYLQSKKTKKKGKKIATKTISKSVQ
jgi:hypothetical protein